MKDLVKTVTTFLTSYDKPESIYNNRTLFQKEYLSMKETLALRMSSEEEGVYLYLEFAT